MSPPLSVADLPPFQPCSCPHPSPVPVPMPCSVLALLHPWGPVQRQRWELHRQHLLPQLSFPLELFRNPEKRDTIIRCSSSDKVWHKQCPGWEMKELGELVPRTRTSPGCCPTVSVPGGPGPPVLPQVPLYPLAWHSTTSRSSEQPPRWLPQSRRFQGGCGIQ